MEALKGRLALLRGQALAGGNAGKQLAVSSSDSVVYSRL